jgi:hypothetical protein
VKLHKYFDYLTVSSFSTLEHVLRLSPSEDDDTFVNSVSDVEMNEHFEIKESKQQLEIKRESSVNGEILANTLVVALTLTSEGSEEWILARIKSFDKKLYAVEDAEVEEEPSIEVVQKEYLILKFT